MQPVINYLVPNNPQFFLVLSWINTYDILPYIPLRSIAKLSSHVCLGYASLFPLQAFQPKSCGLCISLLFYIGAVKSLARPTSLCILFDG